MCIVERDTVRVDLVGACGGGAAVPVGKSGRNTPPRILQAVTHERTIRVAERMVDADVVLVVDAALLRVADVVVDGLTGGTGSPGRVGLRVQLIDDALGDGVDAD